MNERYVPATYVKKVKNKKTSVVAAAAPVTGVQTFKDPTDVSAASEDKEEGAKLVEEVSNQLAELRRLLEERIAALRIAQKQHDFRHTADELASWLDERLAEVHAADTGRDHECKEGRCPANIFRKTC